MSAKEPDTFESESDFSKQYAVKSRLRIRPAIVYGVVNEEGQEELARGAAALWWSGLAAGISMGFSMLAAGILAALLPAAGWAQPLVALGYTAGFVIVITARQQLFTENTITALLPVMTDFSGRVLLRMLRLWAIVFAANLAGAALFAAMTAYGGVADPIYLAAFDQLGQHFVANSALENGTRGVVAGWLIAALVWAMPSVPRARFWMILFFTWLIGLGAFTHIIAGAVEAFFLLFNGSAELGPVVGRFMLPTLIGNVIGGSALFALISYAQVREEIVEILEE